MAQRSWKEKQLNFVAKELALTHLKGQQGEHEASEILSQRLERLELRCSELESLTSRIAPTQLMQRLERIEKSLEVNGQSHVELQSQQVSHPKELQGQIRCEVQSLQVSPSEGQTQPATQEVAEQKSPHTSGRPTRSYEPCPESWRSPSRRIQPLLHEANLISPRRVPPVPPLNWTLSSPRSQMPSPRFPSPQSPKSAAAIKVWQMRSSLPPRYTPRSQAVPKDGAEQASKILTPRLENALPATERSRRVTSPTRDAIIAKCA